MRFRELTDSDRKYQQLQDALTVQWCANCDTNPELTERIEKAKRLLMELDHIGYNIIKGEVGGE